MLSQVSNSRREAGPLPGRAGLPLVVIVQPEVQHYRIPVFDLLREAARDRYDLEVWGQLQDGKAHQGESREYLRHMGYERRRVLGVTTMRSPQVPAEIERLKPHVVVVSTNIRNRTSWNMPRLCHRIGAACVGWGKAFGYSGLPAWLRSLLIRRLFRQFDRIIAYGELTADLAVEHGVPRERIYVANNTIDTRSIFMHERSLRDQAERLREREGLLGKKVLLMISRLEPAKRPGDVLDAWPRLRELDPDLVLVLAGSGVLADELRRRAASLDPERIRFVGRLPLGEDYVWIAASDMTIQCGAIGLAINQSMAFGTATIIADEFGPDSEILEHHVTGWRYTRGDLSRLVDAVAEVLGDSQARDRITQAARERMRTKVTIENMVRQIDRCLSDGLEISSQRRSSP